MAGMVEVKNEEVKIERIGPDITELEAKDSAEEIAAAEELKAKEAEDAQKAADLKAEEEKNAGKTVEEIAAEAKTAEESAALELKKAEKDPDTTKEEIKELRTLLRDLRNENIRLSAVVERHDKVQKGDLGEKIEPGELEMLQESLTKIVETRDFSQLLAAMEVNPKYEDVTTVCTKGRFEDLFEVAANVRVEESQGKLDFKVAYLQVKNEIWSMRNPYLYMYGLIKEYHPDFAKTELSDAEKAEETKKLKEAEEELKKKTAKEVVKGKEIKEAPGSIANLGGGAPGQGGWTAARIDEMPEGELHKVPKDIYQAYLMGELDK